MQVPHMARNTFPRTFRTATSRAWAKPATGFTLVELLITVIIVALLSAIAVPAYNNYVRSSRRTDAIEALLQSQQILENCRTNSASRTYAGCDAQVASGVNPTYYTIAANITSVSGIADVGYTVTATPRAGTTQAQDSKCTTFSINQVGRRSASNDSCWK